VMSSLSCVVPMSTLTSTFAYGFDNLILVSVSSTSEFGTSSNQYNIGDARVRSIPIGAMIAPTVTSSSDSQIIITWPALSGTSAGNSDITAYNVYWNKGTDLTASTKYTETLLTTMNFDSIIGGANYIF
jgi:hypothetical protein